MIKVNLNRTKAEVNTWVLGICRVLVLGIIIILQPAGWC